MPVIPYPRPPRGPLREISDRLELGMLSADSARELCALGLDWKIVAPHVHDIDWWRDQPINLCAPAKQHWNVNAWDATLRLATSETILWIDPGPSAPFPSLPPELVVITHAHADHTDRLEEWVRSFPEMRIVMTPLTAQILSLRFYASGAFRKILDRTIQVEFNERRTISGISLQFLPAGHLLGAAMLELEFGIDRILVTGDFAMREVGGLPGAQIPTGDYAFMVMEATECSKKSLPFADLQSTRAPFLREVLEQVGADRHVIRINTYSLGEAQEAYATLVMAQQAGAFPEFSVCLDGLAASVSNLYSKELAHQSSAWKKDFLKPADYFSTNSLVISPIQGQINTAPGANIIERPTDELHCQEAIAACFVRSEL